MEQWQETMTFIRWKDVTVSSNSESSTVSSISSHGCIVRGHAQTSRTNVTRAACLITTDWGTLVFEFHLSSTALMSRQAAWFRGRIRHVNLPNSTPLLMSFFSLHPPISNLPRSLGDILEIGQSQTMAQLPTLPDSWSHQVEKLVYNESVYWLWD